METDAIVNKFGWNYSEFQEGQKIVHEPRKTIFESDNNLFSLLTMNHHPVHIDLDYAADAKHGKILVVGPLVFSIIVGLTVSTISGRAIANLEYEHVKHTAPVFINDTIRAETVILEKKESKSGTSGVLYVETIGLNQHNQKVIEFRRRVLLENI